MNILSITAFAIIAMLICVLLRQQKPEFAAVTGVVAGVLLLSLIISEAVPILDKLKEFLGNSGVNSEYGEILVKSLGICYITGFASDCCRDAGEGNLSAKIELAGKIAVMLLSLPLIDDVLNISLGLIGG